MLNYFRDFAARTVNKGKIPWRPPGEPSTASVSPLKAFGALLLANFGRSSETIKRAETTETSFSSLSKLYCVDFRCCLSSGVLFRSIVVAYSLTKFVPSGVQKQQLLPRRDRSPLFYPSNEVSASLVCHFELRWAVILLGATVTWSTIYPPHHAFCQMFWQVSNIIIPKESDDTYASTVAIACIVVNWILASWPTFRAYIEEFEVQIDFLNRRVTSCTAYACFSACQNV